MVNNFVEFLKSNATLVAMGSGVFLTLWYSVCYCVLWKDIIRPWWYKRKKWTSLEIHPLYCKGIDSPSDQEWHVGALVMTSNNRGFLTEFFLENTKRVDDALARPVVSPCVKPGSTVIGYKLLTYYPNCLQNRRWLMHRYEKEHEYHPSWELAVSKSTGDWENCLDGTESGVLTGKYGDFISSVPSSKKLKEEKKAFVKEWKGQCRGKSDE